MSTYCSKRLQYLVILSSFLNIVTIFTEVTEQQLLFAQTPDDLIDERIK